jgi:hypothetical protein
VNRSDIISGGLLVLFGLLTIFVIVPVEIDSGGDYGLDPKFFPVTTLWLIVAMAVLQIGHRLVLLKFDRDTPGPLDSLNWLFICGATLFLAMAYFGIVTIGFIATSLILIAIAMVAMGARKQNWLALLSIPIIAPIVIYYALGQIFTVELP